MMSCEPHLKLLDSRVPRKTTEEALRPFTSSSRYTSLCVLCHLYVPLSVLEDQLILYKCCSKSTELPIDNGGINK